MGSDIDTSHMFTLSLYTVLPLSVCLRYSVLCRYSLSLRINMVHSTHDATASLGSIDGCQPHVSWEGR